AWPNEEGSDLSGTPSIASLSGIKKWGIDGKVKAQQRDQGYGNLQSAHGVPVFVHAASASPHEIRLTAVTLKQSFASCPRRNS
ncbi:MAG TPA: hypothetical protein VNZ47_14800, partial [Candidatus Dormibacteraeota bacterium]|nr:hypothetical protein [Candidatus Dormibacteraeota bacterium]